MARKSRKRQTVTLPHLHSETAGYIRLSVTGKGGDDSIENQKKVIEAWARENQHPISRWYIDAGWSGRTFYRPMFRELIADIERGEVDCVVVKDLSRLGRDHIAVGYYLEYIFLSGIHSCTFIRTNRFFEMQVKKYQSAWFVPRFRCIFPPQQAQITLPLKTFSLASGVGLILNERALNSLWILSKVSTSTSGSWVPFTTRFSLPCMSIPV